MFSKVITVTFSNTKSKIAARAALNAIYDFYLYFSQLNWFCCGVLKTETTAQRFELNYFNSFRQNNLIFLRAISIDYFCNLHKISIPVSSIYRYEVLI